MTESERAQILKMIHDGKISAEDGLRLMQAIDEDDDNQEEFEFLEAAQPQGSGSQADPEFARKANRLRKLWAIPLWIGIFLTIGGAGLMYSTMQSTGMGFWFYCAWLPFLLGVLVLALSWSSRTSRWMYLKVDQKEGEHPRRIMFGFPLPVGLIRWVLNTFGHHIPDEERSRVNEVMQAVDRTTAQEGPILIDVEDDDGEHVQVYIG